MHDCFVCALPAEVQAEFSFNDEEWLTMLCADGHWVVLTSCANSPLDLTQDWPDVADSRMPASVPLASAGFQTPWIFRSAAVQHP